MWIYSISPPSLSLIGALTTEIYFQTKKSWRHLQTHNYIHTHKYMHTHTRTYRERETERKTETDTLPIKDIGSSKDDQRNLADNDYDNFIMDLYYLKMRNQVLDL